MSQVAEVLIDVPEQQATLEDGDAPAGTAAAEQQEGNADPGEPSPDPEASAPAGEAGEPEATASAEAAGETGPTPEGGMEEQDGGAVAASPEEGSGEAGAAGEPHASAEPGQADAAEAAGEGQADAAPADAALAEGVAAVDPDIWDHALKPELREKLAEAVAPRYVPPEVGEDYVPVAELPPLPLPYSVDEATGKKTPLAGIESIFLTGAESYVHGRIGHACMEHGGAACMGTMHTCAQMLAWDYITFAWICCRGRRQVGS